MWMFSHAEFSGEDRGCVFATYDDLAEAWGWSKWRVISQIRRWTNKNSGPRLVKKPRTSNGQATDKRTTRQTDSREWCFLLVNYDRYQRPQTESTKQTTKHSDRGSDKRRTSEPQKNSNFDRSESGEKHPTQSTSILTKEQSTKNKKRRDSEKSRSGEKPKTKGQEAKELLDFFSEQHLEIKKEKYHVLGQRDMSAFKRVLNTIPDMEEVKERILRYLCDPQKWAHGHYQWTPTGFEKKLNSYRGSDQSRAKSAREELKEMNGRWK